MPFLDFSIVAPAYAPALKPAAPVTTIQRMGMWGELSLPAIRGATVPKALPLRFKQYHRGGANIPSPKRAYVPRVQTASQKAALERRIAAAKTRHNLRMATRARVGFSERVGASTGSKAIAAAMLAAAVAHITQISISVDVVDKDVQEKKKKSVDCISAFQSIHENFMKTNNFQQDIFDIAIKSDDAAKRYRTKLSSRKNPPTI